MNAKPPPPVVVDTTVPLDQLGSILTLLSAAAAVHRGVVGVVDAVDPDRRSAAADHVRAGALQAAHHVGEVADLVVDSIQGRLVRAPRAGRIQPPQSMPAPAKAEEPAAVSSPAPEPPQP